MLKRKIEPKNEILFYKTFHVVGKIEVLRREIGSITFPVESVKNNQSLITLIKKIVNNHRRLLLISQKIETIYCYICLTQFFASTITLCLAGYLMITVCNISLNSQIVIYF